MVSCWLGTSKLYRIVLVRVLVFIYKTFRKKHCALGHRVVFISSTRFTSLNRRRCFHLHGPEAKYSLMPPGKYVPLKNWEVYYGVIHKPAICWGSRNGVVGRETRLQAGRSGIGIPVKERDFLFSKISRPAEADAAFLSVRIVVVSRV